MPTRLPPLHAKRRIALWLGSILLGASQTLPAVQLSDNGVGQVLLFPYYVSRSNNDTLISITNHSRQVKALKLRVMEGDNGRPIRGVNLYLAPFDSWSASISEGANGPVLHSNDLSCTVPEVNQLPLTLDALNSAPDGGRQSIDRAREGYLEVIEMGEVDEAGLGRFAQITGINPPRIECGPIRGAWLTSDGIWRQDEQTDLLPPSGRISGQAVVINVPLARASAYAATALDHFYQHQDGDNPPSLHSAPEDLDFPNLGSADPARSYVYIDRSLPAQLVEDDWPDGISAVSAVLTVSTMIAPFNQDPDIDAISDHIVTLPTRYLMTQPDRSDFGPFAFDAATIAAQQNQGTACEQAFLGHSVSDVLMDQGINGFIERQLCYSVNALAYTNQALASGSAISHEADDSFSPMLGSRLYRPASVSVNSAPLPAEPPVIRTGWSQLGLNPLVLGEEVPQLQNPDSGRIYYGFPIIGFSAQGAQNQAINARFGSGIRQTHLRAVDTAPAGGTE